MTISRSALTAAIAAGIAAGAPAGAQTLVAAPGPTTLTVVAEGRVTRAPDVAEVSGGVVTTAATAAAAMSENATRMTAVVAAVRRAGVADRDIQTSGLNLQAQYRYENNQAPILTGYQASNTVKLRLRKIADAGRLLDTLVSVGANQLNGPEFRVDDSSAALDEARVQAVATARKRAELYARAAGLKIGRIARISEVAGEPVEPRPMMTTMRAKAADAAPPVEPGEVALTVNVTMVFELE
ncbi:SIMPL domain-containing protein [Sandarakinorhabdus sp. DWP1-3-1]|uniref:SIMPL domain-containing protein n=1 Tax=Sandarakinorhabdus sp. DWP1-3-1 TaxID=2804627 RepID=UPI003CEA7377